MIYRRLVMFTVMEKRKKEGTQAMRKYLKQGIALMLSLVLVLALSACGGKTGNEDKIVIAYIGPLTGGSAIYGIVESDTVQMLVE